MIDIEMQTLLLIALAFAIGGILKGATGAGAPVIVVPLITLLFSAQMAVAVFLVPNIASNGWQAWQHRESAMAGSFTLAFAVAGILGAGVGTFALAHLNGDAMMLVVALAVLLYIGFRLLNPAWKLSLSEAQRIVIPVGIVGGFLQGSAGMSGPASLTFLNAMRLERTQFIFTVSIFFLAMAAIQMPLQLYWNVMTLERFLYGAMAVVPMSAMMPVGAYFGKRLPKEIFDRIILGFLGLLALRMIWAFFTG